MAIVVFMTVAVKAIQGAVGLGTIRFAPTHEQSATGKHWSVWTKRLWFSLDILTL
jgi:hypothetical protein